MALPADAAAAATGLPAVQPQYSFADSLASADGASADDLAFLKDIDGLDDDEKELDLHRSRIAATIAALNAQGLHIYRCIATLGFLRPRVHHHPAYPRLLAALTTAATPAATASTPIVIDIGCAFGTDVRKLLLDGVPADRILASDLLRGYWDAGADRLFADRGAAVATLFADWTSPDGPPPLPPAVAPPARVRAVVASAVLHVFSKPQVDRFARNVHAVLADDDDDGGLFFGTCVGRETAGPWSGDEAKKGSGGGGNSGDGGDDEDSVRYLHSPTSLARALEAAGFVDVEVVAGGTGWGSLTFPDRLEPGGGGSASTPAFRLCFTAVKRKVD
ncbi:hypothetical protein DFJ73DRAFT_798366 [Zopfochytrium polystomum]|nr:hypothetical protein DFJ73DRAFT_798366 [Zopfochytrium polystomum]